MTNAQLNKMDSKLKYLLTVASTKYYVVKFNGKIISNDKGQVAFGSKSGAKIAINAALKPIFMAGWQLGHNTQHQWLYQDLSTGLWHDYKSHKKLEKEFYKQFWDKYLVMQEYTYE